MGKARKCDICGKLFDARMSVPNLRIFNYIHGYEDIRLDLCDDCQKKLEDFVNKGVLER